MVFSPLGVCPLRFLRGEVALLPAAPPARPSLAVALERSRLCPRRPPRSSGGLTRCCPSLLFLLAGVAPLGRSSESSELYFGRAVSLGYVKVTGDTAAPE